MEPKDSAAGASRLDQREPSLYYQIAMALLCPSALYIACLYTAAVTLVLVRAGAAINIDGDYPMSSSVQLAGVKGLEAALAPGAVSPSFDLLVRVDNGRIYDEYREGGSVTVSYAGVALAHGRTPSFRVAAKEAVTFTVKATAGAVGVPAELFRLMSAERRWGAAQLEVSMQLGWPGGCDFTSAKTLAVHANHPTSEPACGLPHVTTLKLAADFT
ncbi:hypothetical protein EJB05_57024, partial [Eragrostis curvula]